MLLESAVQAAKDLKFSDRPNKRHLLEMNTPYSTVIVLML